MHRDVARVFQSYALYLHMTVSENISFGLRLRRIAADKIANAVSGAAAVLNLDQLLARRPSQLSGGQRQRVATGRAMVRDPRLFLFDEPRSDSTSGASSRAVRRPMSGAASGTLAIPGRTPSFGDTNWTDVFSELRLGSYEGSIDIEGWHDPVYRDALEMTGQVHALNYLKQCRGGAFVANLG